MLLTFDFKTVEEAQEFLAGLVAKPQTAGVADESLARDLAAEPAKAFFTPEGSTAVAAIVEPEKKKRGPKPKAGPVKEKVYGIEDCRTALSGLFDVKGRDAAKAALAEFKVARIGELKADQYRGFIVLCETLSQPE